MNVRIWHYIFLILAIPLAFHLSYVFGVQYLLRIIEGQTNREYHSRQVIEALGQVGTNLSKEGTLVVVYNGCQDSELLRLLKNNEAQLNARLEYLCRLTAAEDREQQGRVVLVKRAALEVARIESMITKLPPDASIKQLFPGEAAVNRLSAEVKELYKNINDAASYELGVQEKSRRESEHLRGVLSAAILVWLFLCVSSALLLLLFLLRRLGDRIERIGVNLTRLSNREKLEPTLDGSDEIARLDTTFHETASQLMIAENSQRQLVAMVSHELRTPLQSVLLSLEMIASGAFGELPEDADQRLGVAQSDTERMIGLINDILDLERLQSGKFELEFDTVLVQDILVRAKSTAEELLRCSTITLQTFDGAERIKGDQTRLVQVVVNLLCVAAKASTVTEVCADVSAPAVTEFCVDSSSSTVTAVIGECRDSPGSAGFQPAPRDVQRLQPKTTVHASSVACQMRSDGASVTVDLSFTSSADFATYFHKTVSTTASKVDALTRLRLAICQKIIELHGGALSAKYDERIGTTVTVTLPAIRAL